MLGVLLIKTTERVVVGVVVAFLTPTWPSRAGLAVAAFKCQNSTVWPEEGHLTALAVMVEVHLRQKQHPREFRVWGSERVVVVGGRLRMASRLAQVAMADSDSFGSSYFIEPNS